MTSQNEVIIHVGGRNTFGATAKQATAQAQGLGRTLQGVGKIAGGFLAAQVIQRGAGAFLGFMGDAKSAASNLNESINAVNVTFGAAAQRILEWGEANANAIGLSRRALNEAAVPIGAMLQNMGLSADQAGETTLQLAERASDLASVFNVDLEDALLRIQAALRGEADPIERFGVNVKQTAVNLKALEMTGKSSAAALTEGEKAAARLALIFEQTDKTAGDFANTSDDLANATRKRTAADEDHAATLGQKLLPAYTALNQVQGAAMRILATEVIPTIEAFVRRHLPSIKAALDVVRSAFQTVWPALQKIIEVFVDHVAIRIQGFINMIKGIAQIVSGVAGVVKAIAAGDWSAAWDNLKDVAVGALQAIVGFLQTTFGKALELMVNAIIEAVNQIRGPLNFVVGLGNKLGLGLGEIPEIGKVDFGGDLFAGLEGVKEQTKATAEELKGFDAGLLDFGADLPDLGAELEGTKTLLQQLVEAFRDSRDAGEKLVTTLGREASQKLRSAASAIFGNPTQEQADLMLKLAELDERIARRSVGGQDLSNDKRLQELKDQRELIRGRLEVELAVTNKLRARVDAEDGALLTAQEQAALAAELKDLTIEQSDAFRDMIDLTGQSLVPAMDDAREAFDNMKLGIDFLTDESLYANLIPAMGDAAEATKNFKDVVVDVVSKIRDKIGAARLREEEYRQLGLEGFASGGVVSGPIGKPRLVVAHGGETISPPGQGGGEITQAGQQLVSQTFHVTVNGVTNAAELLEELQQMSSQQLAGAGLQ